jgi:lysophospholipase L1-like esterase
MLTKRWLLLIYIAGLHIFVVLAMLYLCFPDHYRWGYFLPSKPLISTKCYRITHSFHQTQLQQLVPGDFVFIGDSHIQGWHVEAVTKGAFNLGIGGDTIIGLRGRLKDYNMLKSAGRIVVLIGINDLLNGISIEVFEQRVSSLAESLPTESRITWLALLPTDLIKYDDLLSANVIIENYCHRLKNCQFLDVGPLLLGEAEAEAVSGSLHHRFDRGDRLHLNAIAYKRLTDFIAPVIDVR